MARHGLEVFDNTLQKTHEWLNDLMHLLNWDDRHKAYCALRSTLQSLRDRLPIEIAAKLGAQLPMLVRGFYYEGWKPSLTPIKVKGKEEFFEFVAAHAAGSNLSQEDDIEQIVRAAFQVLAMHISDGEIEHLKRVLPVGVANLWKNPESVKS